MYLKTNIASTNDKKIALPLSFITTKNKGPKLSKDGQLLDHTLLGDAQDFITQSEKYSPTPIPITPKQTNDDQLIQQQRLEMLKAQEKEDIEKREFLNKLYIFQRYAHVRQEHALKNWARHCAEWSLIESRLSNKLKRSRFDLVTEKISQYRIIMEEKEFMAEALRLLEDSKIDFWQSGLKIGGDLLGISCTLPNGGKRE